MSFIQELRGSLENPQTPLSYPAEWLTDIYNGGRTDSGLRVSQMTALQIPTVFTCINILARGLAALPLNVMEIASGPAGRMNRALAYDHDLQDILHDRPHPEMSSFTWRSVMMIYALLWGNAYAEILRNELGDIAALAPRAPWKTVAIRLTRDIVLNGKPVAKGTMGYKTTQGVDDSDVINDDTLREGRERFILASDMIYVPGLTLDGRVGQDTVFLMRQAFGLALATEKFGAKFFGNGGHPGGVLELLGNVPKEEMEKARMSFQEATGGENMHRIFVTKGSTKFTPMSTPNNDAQFLETRKFQVQQISAVFQVPLHMLGEPGTNRATAEQLGQEFVNYTLGPWIPAFEQELKYKLFTLPMQGQRGRNAGRRFEPKFDVRNLVYPDSTSKSNFYQKGKLSGYMNTNMILEMEGLNPISEEDGGEDFWQPVNVTVIGAEPPTPPADSEPEQPGETEPEQPGESEPEQKSAPDFANQIRAALPLFTDAFTRLSKRQKADVEDFTAILRPVLLSLRTTIAVDVAADMCVDLPAEMPEGDKFLTKYVAGIHKRGLQDVQNEVGRATRALAIECYRELAVKRVK